MKIYEFWQVESEMVRIGRDEVEIRCYGGSNVSADDARLKAREKIGKVKRRIGGEAHVFDDYEVEIREEIVQVLDEKAVVTRNRYGAQVLNVEDLMILDIDRPKFAWGDLFRKRDEAADKQRIVEMVRKLAQKPVYQGCGFRVYETRKGIRVIVLGKTFEPAARAAVSMMKDFNCDRLYALLCRKKNCYRARLTPKASRMNYKGHRVKFPRGSEEETAFREWLAGYEAARASFGVCNLVEQIGFGYSVPQAVRFHDEITGVGRNLPLA